MYDIINKIFMCRVLCIECVTMKGTSRIRRMVKRTASKSTDSTLRARIARFGAAFTMVLILGSAPVSAQSGVCETAIGSFSSDLITAALALGLAALLLAFIVAFGFRPIAFSGNLMSKLSNMSSQALVGLAGIVFVAVIFTWMLSYSTLSIPKGCTPLMLSVLF